MSRNPLWLLLGIFLLCAIFVTTNRTTAHAQNLLTDRQRTETFHRELQEVNAQIDERLAADTQRFQAALATLMASRQRHDAATSNVERFEISRGTLCDPDIVLPLFTQEPNNRLVQSRSKFKEWSRLVSDRLGNDPIENVYLWYQRYDFVEKLETYKALEALVARDLPQIFGDTCRMLDDSIFAELRPVAVRMDEMNEEKRAIVERINARTPSQAQRQALEARIAALDVETAELDRRRERLLQFGTVQQSQAVRDFRFSIQSLTSKLSALEMPERGHITGQRPNRIKFRNRTRFGIHMLGSGIPRGLGSADIGLPDGLRLLSISGGGNDLYLYLEKTDALGDGTHEIDIAGEKVTFRFEDADVDDAQGDQPLMSRNEETLGMPASEGQIPEDGKGTLLTPQVLTDHPQDQWGYWQYAEESRPEGEDDRAATFRIAGFDDVDGKRWTVLMGLGFASGRHESLAPHQRMAFTELLMKGVHGQYDRVEGACMSGLRAVREARDIGEEEDCPEWRWWAPSNLCFEPNNIMAMENVDSKKHDAETCESGEQHVSLKADYERFVGLTFAPIGPGKYIHTGTVAAPFQFLAEVKLAWDYGLLDAGRRRLIIRRLVNGEPHETLETLEDLEPVGEHAFSTQQTGQYGFEVQVYDAQDELVHRDFAAAFLDR